MIVIEPKIKDIGGFSVRRSLPSLARRSVGPFIFFDYFGPATIGAGINSDVRPHPHIGLATVTTLFAGALRHRDSLGVDQVIEPGAVNWMTAGSGIVHSERAPPGDRERARPIHGLQLWVALPVEHEDAAPSFRHYPAASLPVLAPRDGVRVRLLAGDAFGGRAPVETLSPLFYAELRMQAGTTVDLEGITHAERALLVMDGAASLQTASGTAPLAPARLAVLDEDERRVVLRADTDVHAIVLGGAPLDGPRHVWWNYASSSREKIALARERWRDRGFPAIPGDDDEFIPLPEETP